MTAQPTMTPEQELAALSELLAQHQELGRLQGNRLDEVSAELGATQAKLRVALEENSRLLTRLNAATKATP